jgi:hypothetical protein
MDEIRASVDVLKQLAGLSQKASHLGSPLERLSSVAAVLERIFISLRRPGTHRSAMHAAPFLTRYGR